MTGTTPAPNDLAIQIGKHSPRKSQHSRLFQRLDRRYANELSALSAGAPSRVAMLSCLDVLMAQGMALGPALRVLRQLVMHRIIQLDCEEGAPVAIVTQAMTDLAEIVLDQALSQAKLQLEARHGIPLKADGRRAQLWVIGMGKLGARELNVSSDIDLIYVYDEDGETAGLPDGRGKTTVHEYFCKVVKVVYSLVGEPTDHGFVFRVDLALRPNGNSGPACVSLAALEEYFQVQGREWERFAWLKSRIVAPTRAICDASAQALRPVVLPFVFRRYLDYNVFASLRTLHGQIRAQAVSRAAMQAHRANDVKLGRGGIREIEFIVQLLQVVRGGQFPELRTRPTLRALPLLVRAGLMGAVTADRLSVAYTFLRQVEHRIQYLDDQQTQVMPTDEKDIAWIADTMGFADTAKFMEALAIQREFVAQEFDTLLGGGQDSNNGAAHTVGSELMPANPVGQGASFAGHDLAALLPDLPEALRLRCQDWMSNPRVQGLRDEARVRLLRLVQRTGQWVDDAKVSGTAAVRLIDWMESLLRRESYFAMLLERPAVHARLCRLLGEAKWPARYLQQHPGVIDELASQDLITSRFNGQEFESELETRRASLAVTGEDDEEALLNLLRRACHAEVFRTLARDVEQAITVEQVADDLSALADTVLRLTTRWCWQRLRNKHNTDPDFVPQFAIIAYGKLGGKELGYGSDLDIVFVFQDEAEQAPQAYAALVRKLITWLTVKTGEGDLFEIDTALRPNGNSGLLITTFDAYADYQMQRGSNTAWTWEHQAMTRARFVLGSEPLHARFEEVRKRVITTARDVQALKLEVMAMRERVRQAHPVAAGKFDVKHSEGGMVDAEFAVQTLVLGYSRLYPQLVANVGNIALLQRAEEVGLLPPGIGQGAADAYRQLRRVQHRARLDETSTQFEPSMLVHEQHAIMAVWRIVFDAGSGS
jgi:[glutamine synthetase] adenylyltransferase / [glutamine synthetase]-adenylyl-L-tyrosine phosphorylase